MRNVTEIQRELIRLGFLADGQDDGKFGPVSMDAYNHFLASKGKPKHEGLILLTELNAELFPDELPAPKPKKPSLFETIALNAILSKLKGSAVLNILTGYKTYIVGLVMALLGIAAIAGIQIPGFPVADGGKTILEAFAIIFLRKAAG